MPKRKSVFSDELRQKYPCFKKGRSDFEAECITCGYGTFISVANKSSISLDNHIKTTKHKQAIRSETSSFKVTDYFLNLARSQKMKLQLPKPPWHFIQ